MTICPHCSAEFSPRRADQVYCSAKCRQAHYHATKGDGALRVAITAVRRLKGGGVSVTNIDDDEFACVGLDVSDAEALLEVLLDICPNAKALAHNWLLEEQKREHLKGWKP